MYSQEGINFWMNDIVNSDSMKYSYFSKKTYIVDTRKKCLIGTLLMIQLLAFSREK